MKARYRGRLWGRALNALDWIVHKLEAVLARGRERRPSASAARRTGGAPVHADERTMRRVAEAQAGGMSSEESAARYARGENPGGLHQKEAHRGEGRLHQRPGDEEPQERKETVPGKERHIAVNRKGS
jgi:hypothetical protein